MAEPKKRLTSTRSGNRRSHLSLKKIHPNKCQKCEEPIKPHHVCGFCGTYNGKQVINIGKEKKKKG